MAVRNKTVPYVYNFNMKAFITLLAFVIFSGCTAQARELPIAVPGGDNPVRDGNPQTIAGRVIYV